MEAGRTKKEVVTEVQARDGGASDYSAGRGIEPATYDIF